IVSVPPALARYSGDPRDGTAEYLQLWEERQSIARRREPLEPDARLFDQAPAGAAVNVRGQLLPPQPGSTRGADALHPGAHAAWLCTPAPPGLRSGAHAAWLCTPAPQGLRSGAHAAWLCTPAPQGLRPETRAAWLCTPAPPGLRPARVVVIRNDTNRGFPAGRHQGLA